MPPQNTKLIMRKDSDDGDDDDERKGKVRLLVK